MARTDKFEALAACLSRDELEQAIVFTRTKHGANRLVKKLEKRGLAAAAIHGNKSQNARERALGAFREGSLSILVATDIASRGLDIDGVSHVINYDLPNEPEVYVHCIGRTGRAGRAGIAVASASPSSSGSSSTSRSSPASASPWMTIRGISHRRSVPWPRPRVGLLVGATGAVAVAAVVVVVVVAAETGDDVPGAEGRIEAAASTQQR